MHILVQNMYGTMECQPMISFINITYHDKCGKLVQIYTQMCYMDTNLLEYIQKYIMIGNSSVHIHKQTMVILVCFCAHACRGCRYDHNNRPYMHWHKSIQVYPGVLKYINIPWWATSGELILSSTILIIISSDTASPFSRISVHFNPNSVCISTWCCSITVAVVRYKYLLTTLTLSKRSPGFYVSAVKVFCKH